jgi:hypothetical protein
VGWWNADGGEDDGGQATHVMGYAISQILRLIQKVFKNIIFLSI